jgi:hypothetical protein
MPEAVVSAVQAIFPSEETTTPPGESHVFSREAGAEAKQNAISAIGNIFFIKMKFSKHKNTKKTELCSR